MPNISIRHATAAELHRVVLVTELAYKIPYKENTIITKPHEPENVKEKFLNKDFFVLTAVCDDKIVGAVRYEIRKNNHLYFFRLAVLKAYRKKRIGSLLVKKIESIAKRKKCGKILLDCVKEKKLDEYYKKFGFKIDTVRKNHGYHEFFMSKKI